MERNLFNFTRHTAQDLKNRAHTIRNRSNNDVRWIDGDQAKRAFDIGGALVLIVFFVPIFAFVAFAVWLRGDGPVLFSHRRIGRGDTSFDCLKFRTMHIDSDRMLADCLANSVDCRREWENTGKLRHDPRVGRIGHLLRTSSLDELPQLFNVLRGEMSLVGPRPIIAPEIANYGDDFSFYRALRPGITGLWQVSGRNNTTYPERVALDVSYAKNRTMAGDFSILMRTVSVVLTGHGAY